MQFKIPLKYDRNWRTCLIQSETEMIDYEIFITKQKGRSLWLKKTIDRIR